MAKTTTKMKAAKIKELKEAFENATFEGIKTTELKAFRIREDKIVDGKTEKTLRCSCGHEYTFPMERSEEYAPCPKCGEQYAGTVFIRFMSNNVENEEYCICNKTGYAVVPWKEHYALLEIKDTYSTSSAATMADVKIVSRVMAQSLILNNGEEWQLFPCSKPRYYRDSSTLRKLCKKGKETISRASDIKMAIGSHQVMGSEGLPFNLQNIITNAMKEPEKNTAPKKTLMSLNDKVDEHEISSEFLAFPEHLTISKIIKADENGTLYENRCCCGKVTTSAEPEAICENSKVIRKSAYSSYYSKVGVDVVDYLQDEDIFVVRTFIWTLNEDTMNPTVEETERFFIGAKVKEAYAYNETGWVRVSIAENSVHKVRYYNAKKRTVATEAAEQGLDNSFLKYASCRDVWGKVGHEEAWDFSATGYIQNWLERPIIESLYKMGLSRAYDDIKSLTKKDYKEIFGSKKSLAEVFGINKQVLKMARELNCGIEEIKKMQEMWNADQAMTPEVYTVLKNGGYTYDFCQYRSVDVRDLAIEVKTDNGIPFAKQIEYIQNVVEFQCIEFAEAYRIWRDYLHMAKDIKLNISKASLKYPESLKLSHDKATFIFKSLKAEIDREHFKKAVEENKKYEYSLDKLFAKAPETPEEIVDEGNQQSHCVSRYVQQVRDMKTAIVFIRRKENPDISFYTVEIKNDSIQQVKGFGNALATEPEVLRFLDKWMKAKKLKKNTRDF